MWSPCRSKGRCAARSRCATQRSGRGPGAFSKGRRPGPARPTGLAGSIPRARHGGAGPLLREDEQPLAGRAHAERRLALQVDEAAALDDGAAGAALAVEQAGHRHAARAGRRLLVRRKEGPAATARPGGSAGPAAAPRRLSAPPCFWNDAVASASCRSTAASADVTCDSTSSIFASSAPSRSSSASSVARRFAKPFISFVRASTLR